MDVDAGIETDPIRSALATYGFVDMVALSGVALEYRFL
jgi:hypothetical protein